MCMYSLVIPINQRRWCLNLLCNTWRTLEIGTTPLSRLPFQDAPQYQYRPHNNLKPIYWKGDLLGKPSGKYNAKLKKYKAYESKQKFIPYYTVREEELISSYLNHYLAFYCTLPYIMACRSNACERTNINQLTPQTGDMRWHV